MSILNSINTKLVRCGFPRHFIKCCSHIIRWYQSNALDAANIYFCSWCKWNSMGNYLLFTVSTTFHFAFLFQIVKISITNCKFNCSTFVFIYWIANNVINTEMNTVWKSTEALYVINVSPTIENIKKLYKKQITRGNDSVPKIIPRILAINVADTT